MIDVMDMESKLILMENMRVNGSMIEKKDKVYLHVEMVMF